MAPASANNLGGFYRLGGFQPWATDLSCDNREFPRRRLGKGKPRCLAHRCRDKICADFCGIDLAEILSIGGRHQNAHPQFWPCSFEAPDNLARMGFGIAIEERDHDGSDALYGKPLRATTCKSGIASG